MFTRKLKISYSVDIKTTQTIVAIDKRNENKINEKTRIENQMARETMDFEIIDDIHDTTIFGSDDELNNEDSSDIEFSKTKRVRNQSSRNTYDIRGVTSAYLRYNTTQIATKGSVF